MRDLSVEEQRAAVRAWATENDHRIVREFQDDASGLDSARRRDFLALLHVCTQPQLREAAVVLVYDVSRFSRLEPDEAAFHEHSLRRAGVRVVYTHEPGANEEGVAGHLVKSLKRVLAHEYSTKLSQLVRRGLRAHAELGHWTGGRPPYGYRRAVRGADGSTVLLERGRWKARGERVVLVIDPVEAETVRGIFDAYTRGRRGLLTIVGELNARGVPPPDSGAVRSRAWRKSTLWALVHNPIYRGDLVWSRARYRELGKKRGKRVVPEADRVIRRDAVPAIVSRETWEAAQHREGRRFGTGRPWHRPYLLSGLITCVDCGKRFQAQRQYRGRVSAVYVCGGYAAGGRDFCRTARIPTSYFDDAVLDGIQKRLERVLDPLELRRRLEAVLPGTEDRGRALATVQTRRREVQARIGRLVNALAAGTDDLPSVRAELGALERERGQLERQADEIVARPAADRDSLVAELIARLANVRQVLDSGEPEERKAVVRNFLAGITVDRTAGRAVLRWYRLPQHSGLKLVAVGGIEPPTRGL